MIEKKYEVNGVKTNYLSELYLQCHAKMSQKTKLDIVTKAVDQINKKYFEDDFEKKMEATLRGQASIGYIVFMSSIVKCGKSFSRRLNRWS